MTTRVVPPSFDFFPGDWLVETSSFTLEEEAVFLRLLIYQWGVGHLPKTAEAMMITARIADRQKWDAVWNTIQGHFACLDDGETLVHPGIDKIRKKAIKTYAMTCHASKLGVEARRAIKEQQEQETTERSTGRSTIRSTKRLTVLEEEEKEKEQEQDTRSVNDSTGQAGTWAAPVQTCTAPGPGAAPAHENGAKTKPKKTPQKFCLTDCEDYQKLPAAVQQVITDWMEYKRERNEGYKPTGLKQFVSLVARRVAETRAEVVVEQFRRSMSSGWAGWDFALPAGSEPKPTAPAIYKKPQDYDAALTAELKRAREIREGRDAREYRDAREEEIRRQELMRQIRAIEQLAEKETVR